MAKISKIDSAKNRLKSALAKNETLQKAGAALKRANTAENRQMLAIGGLAAGGGAVAGYKAQEYVEASTSLPDMAKAIGGVPTLTIVGAGLAVYAAMRLKGPAQAGVAGFAGGMAGGAYVHKLANA